MPLHLNISNIYYSIQTTMKKILLFLCMAVFGLNIGLAQSQNNDETVIYVKVPKKFKIKHQIEVVNASPFWIDKAVVALAEDNSLSPICILNHIAPGKDEDYHLRSQKSFRSLRGKTLAIKAKGIKVGKNINLKKGELIAITDESQLTYSFKATLSNRHHNLYITLQYVDEKGKDGKSIMDF